MIIGTGLNCDTGTVLTSLHTGLIDAVVPAQGNNFRSLLKVIVFLLYPGRTFSLVLDERCLTSAETAGLLGTGAQNRHLDFDTAPEL